MTKEGGGDITWEDLGSGPDGKETAAKKSGKSQRGKAGQKVESEAVRVAIGLKEGNYRC